MWHLAYLEQARSDWKIYKTLKDLSLDDCHALHYLQMTTEKLAKAMLLARGAEIKQIRSSHKAFLRFLQIAARHPSLPRLLKIPAKQFLQFTRSLLPLADNIQSLAPALARNGPNVEYPWEEPSGMIRVPASFRFSVSVQLRQPSGRKLLRFIKVILERFETLFVKENV